MNIVNIDAAWLASHPTPYQLVSANTTYVLQADVSTPAGSFKVAASGVTLDLGPYTVTYDDVPPIVVPNGGFESGDFAGWDVSGMPHLSIGDVATVPGLWGDHFAKFSAPASATPAKETLLSAPIAIPAAGVAYEGAIVVKGMPSWGPAVAVSIVDAADPSIVLSTLGYNPGIIDSGVTCYTPAIGAAWVPATTKPVRLRLDITPAPNRPCTVAIDYATLDRTAVYGLAFGPNLANFRLISSSSAGSGASAGKVAIAGGMVTGIEVDSPGSGYATPPTVIVTNNTGPTTGLDAVARAVLSGGRVAGFAIDDGGNGYRTAVAYLLSGGRIVQGAGRSTRSDAIHATNATGGFTVEGVGVAATGRDSMLINMAYDRDVTIRNCTLVAGLSNISNRQAAMAMVKVVAGGGAFVIEGNVLRGAHQNGIAVNPVGGATSVAINRNDIRHNSTWGNSYGIGIAAAKNFEMLENVILPIAGRGIMLEATVVGTNELSLTDGRVMRNTVVAQERSNLEYGYGIDAAALRMRNYGPGRYKNLVIEANSLVALAGSAPGMSMFAAGGKFNFQNISGCLDGANVVFRNNLFKGIVVDKTLCPPNYVAYGLVFCRVDPGTGMSYLGNTLESNMRPLNFGSSDGINESDITMIGTTLVKSADGDQAVAYRTIEVGDWTSTVHNVRLIDTTYQGGASASPVFETATAKDISFGHTLTLTVVDGSGVPQAGAAVAVQDAAGASLFAGTTDAAGDCVAPIVLTSYTVPANSPKNVPVVATTPQPLAVKAGTEAAAVTMTGPTSATVVLGGGPAPVEGSAVLDGSGDLAAEGSASWPAAEGACVLDGAGDLAAEGRARWRFVVYDPVPY